MQRANTHPGTFCHVRVQKEIALLTRKKRKRNINRPNVSEGCMTHCPSVNSQLIRSAVARHQETSRPRRGWPGLNVCHMTTRLTWRDGRVLGGREWKADLCKHTANKQTNPRGRGNPRRLGPNPAQWHQWNAKRRQWVWFNVVTKQTKKKHWFWQVLFHERLKKTPNLHISQNPWFNLQYCCWKKEKKGSPTSGTRGEAEKRAETESLAKACEGRWQLRREEEGMPCCGFVCFCVSV